MQCKRCVMDDSAQDFIVNSEGSNYCTSFLYSSQNQSSTLKNKLDTKLISLVGSIKKAGFGKKFDCIIGVSGGIDSSYVLAKAIDLGLKPLAVHMDNGWDSEPAQRNIHSMLKNLNIPLETYVIEWDEYRDLMEAFFSEDVVDIELLYDNAMLAVNYIIASKYNVKYILNGRNLSSEGMRMPPGWNHFKLDKLNIKEIAKRHGIRRLNTYPSIGVLSYLYYKYVNRIQSISTTRLLTL